MLDRIKLRTIIDLSNRPRNNDFYNLGLAEHNYGATSIVHHLFHNPSNVLIFDNFLIFAVFLLICLIYNIK